MAKKYDIYFDLKEIGKPNKKGKKTVALVDKEGYICGLHATYKHAKQAMKQVRKNLIKEFKRRDKLGISK